MIPPEARPPPPSAPAATLDRLLRERGVFPEVERPPRVRPRVGGARGVASLMSAAVARLDGALQKLNRAVVVVCMAAMIVAAGVLTYSVIARYFLRIATDWQDETAAFLLVGATFMSAAFVQARRGHVSIEVLAPLLSPRLNRARVLLVDLISLSFCAFFAWKSWTLLLEAVEEGYHSGSTWAPPLWIPYSLMAVGMTLLSIQILLQVVEELRRRGRRQ